MPRQQPFVTPKKFDGNGSPLTECGGDILDDGFLQEPPVPVDGNKGCLKRKHQFAPEDIPQSPPCLREEDDVLHHGSCGEPMPVGLEFMDPNLDEKPLEDDFQPLVTPKTPLDLDESDDGENTNPNINKLPDEENTESNINKTPDEENTEPNINKTPDEENTEPNINKTPDEENTEPLADEENTEPNIKKKIYKTSETQRKNSREWHKKWLSKGVPREEKSSEGASGSSSEAPSLAKTKDQFISNWLLTCGLPPSNERRKKAIQAWLESPIRANIMAGRQGIQK